MCGMGASLAMWSGPATSDFSPSSNYRSAKHFAYMVGESRPPRKAPWVAMTHWQHLLLDSSGLTTILGRKWGQHTSSLSPWKPPLSLDLSGIQEPPHTSEPTVALTELPGPENLGDLVSSSPPPGFVFSF